MIDGPAGEHLPIRLAEETVRFVQEHADAPFLAYLSFYSVHIPLQSRGDLQRKYERKKAQLGLINHWDSLGDNRVRRVQSLPVYASMVAAMDEAVGRVLRYLRESGLDQRTVVILTSDNGGLSTAEGHPTANLPLKAGKGWLYEGGIREPLIVRWPGVTAPGTTNDHPVISTDFYPTMLAMAHLPRRPNQHPDGVSMVPLLRNQDAEPRSLFWHYPHYGNQGGAPGSAVREGEWKLIEWFEGNRRELYNLSRDPGETTNVADTHPDIVRQLYQGLKDWRQRVGARYPRPNPASQP